MAGRTVLPRTNDSRLDDWSPQLLKSRLYGQLLVDIIVGRLAPGERLDERALAKRYGGGLAGIREALARLALEGLVVRRARVGTMVAALDLMEAREAFAARALVEIECAGLASRFATEADIAAIRATLKGAENAIARNDVRALAAMDEAFHVAVAQASHNRVLAKMVMTLHHQTARFWLNTMREPSLDESRRALSEHHALADAIAGHDVARAREAMRQSLGDFPADLKRTWDAMSLRPSISLAALSVVFFFITASTFSSLGVVLPAMIGELHWSWGAAGTGFSLLGVAVGVTSTIPASMIRHMGVRATLVTGSLVMAAAFFCLMVTHGLALYFLGCLLAGLGFTLLATVPGTYLLARLFAQPSFPFGLYFTVGGLGGVAGPILYLWVQSATQNWRAYWLVSLVIVTVAGLLSAILVDTKTDVHAGGETDSHITDDAWSAKAAFKTPQFAVLAAAYSIFPFVGITVNAVAVGHLMRHGVSVAVAGGAMSLEALFNAGARFMGGVLVRWISAKMLLLLALALMMAGLMALSVAHGPALMIVYALGVGAGYGLTFFASTIMLLDYFGRAPNLELFAAVNLISTIGAAGPAFAGFVSDHAGSFVPAFVILEALVLIVLIGVAPMHPPKRRA